MEKIKVHRGWRVVTIIVGILSIISLTFLGIYLRNETIKSTSLTNDLENVYQRAYYELVGNINNIEIGFSKLKVTNTNATKIETLNTIAKNAHLAGTALSTLSAQNLQVVNTTRYINQTGDFATYMMKKYVNNKPVSEDDKKIMDSLYKMTREIGDNLAKINTEINKGAFKFTKVLESNKGIVFDVFNGLEEVIVDYPSLIYDGPFSAGLLDKEPKALDYEEITTEEGVTIINEMFKEFDITDVKYTETAESFFTIFRYSAKKDDKEVTIEITQYGGKLTMVNFNSEVNEPDLKPDECAELAEQYADKLGFDNMKSVWVSNYNSVIFVNLASVQNGVILYPDLVKMKISSKTGDLLGVEALTYVYNHHDRTIPSPVLSESEAIARVSNDITIDSVRLALVPSSDGTEYLSYEISGKAGEDQYYVYIDAITGEEKNILRVIESDEGSLLL